MKRLFGSISALGLTLALVLVGCGGTETKPGASSDVTAGSDEVTQIADGTAGETADAEGIDKAANCVYVSWCNEPGYWGTVCSGTGCNRTNPLTRIAAELECYSDARRVCGTVVSPWTLRD
jgi:hypothetical protein